MDKHTPGPWFADEKGNIWRRNPAELYENGGTVAGDKPIAVVNKGWYGEGSIGYPIEANARRIAAAPELMEALERLLVRMNLKETLDIGDHIAIKGARAALAKARGEQE